MLLHPSLIERFTAHAPGLTGVSRRTLRTNLRFVARRVVPQLCPPDLPLPRERARAPYSPAEISGYLALAAAQPTQARRMRAAGLVGLGAGAGLIRADLRQVRGTDITARSGGVIVEVRGRRPRAVPVLARYHEILLASAGFAGKSLVTGGTDPGRHNVTTPLITALAGGTGLPRLDTSRLRATWLAEAAELLGLATFMAAAGITCSQRLRTGPHLLTYRQAEYTFNLLADALAKDEPDGTPSGALARTCDDLLEASIPAAYKDASAALAADWTDAETWSRPPRHGATSCADHEAHWGHRNSNLPGPKGRDVLRLLPLGRHHDPRRERPGRPRAGPPDDPDLLRAGPGPRIREGPDQHARGRRTPRRHPG